MAASQLEFIVLMVVLTTTTITTSGFPTVTDQVGPQNHPQVASAVMSQDVPQPAPQVTPISTSTAPLDAQQDVNAAPQVAPLNQVAPEVAPQPSPDVAPSSPEYQLNALNRHNYYRSIHNAPAMQLDKELSRYASTWAAKMAQSGTLTRGYRGDVGSNTKIECDGTQDDGIQVVDSWYKDVCNYDFNTHQPVIGLFSQLVWKSSTSLGIGRSRGNYRGFACTYWVAVYKPPGNYEISREWNVDKGSFDWNAVCNPDSGQITAPPPVTAAPVPVTSTAATPETAPPTPPATGAPPEVTTTPTPPVTTQQADNYQEYQLNALNRHNYYRRIHNAPAMQLDKELSRYASTWAAKMAQSGTLTRGYRGDVGSNTKIECDGTQDDGIQVVDSWYKDVCNYNFNTHQPVIGLFSQLVWKSSTSLGIGRSRGNYGGFACTYWVAVYKPPGNYEISREWNVDKGSFDWNAVCNPDSGQITAPPPVTAAPVPVTNTAATPETAPPTPPATGAPPEVTTTPTPPVTTQQADNYQEYQLNALNRHNYYRSIHNAPAMQLDKELSRYASTWAAKMAQSGTLTRGYRGDVGSNTKIECDGTQDDGIQVVDSWYKDVCNYDFNAHQPVIGLFSQLVWKSSTSLGIGRSRGNYRGFACTYWVAVYKPPGNYEISREWNVDRGRFDWNAVCNPYSGQTTASPPVTAVPAPVTTTPAVVTTTSTSNSQDFQVNALNRHNYYRHIHNAPPMQLDKELSGYASAWAAKMARSHMIRTNRRGHLGQNVAVACDDRQADGIDVVDRWYKDVCNYNFNSHQPVGLFSQLVWKSSTQLGIGRSRGMFGGFDCTYWAAYYKPTGNMIGTEKWNVDKGSFDRNAVCKDMPV
ncbi:predicted protein [Nematostella vectensis]|uniref:SCP domain-containing protein n=1 Tax=Nematostella vectensis TaxID=45351 RepID=A7SBE5_NEMVE|nr:predicted protein [Nematostella vectensis]|eukprot:XP_001631074.1 predicted protein [Nematostella vectensis]